MEEMTWTQRWDARNEQRLRELASDLADRVAAGEMTELEANELYTRTADRLMHEN